MWNSPAIRRPEASFRRTTKSERFCFVCSPELNRFCCCRHDDLKQMLDSNKDTLKLEAMKRIIGMVAKVRSVRNVQKGKMMYIPVAFAGSRCVGFVPGRGEERRLEEPRGEEARLRLLGAVRGGAAGPGAAVHFDLPARAEGPQPADPGECVARSLQHPRLDDRSDCDAGDPRLGLRHEPVRPQDGRARDPEALQLGRGAEGGADHGHPEAALGPNDARRRLGCDGLRGGVPRAGRPDPQKLSQAVQSARRRGRVGPGGDHQHADALRPPRVQRPERRDRGRRGAERRRGVLQGGLRIERR